MYLGSRCQTYTQIMITPLWRWVETSFEQTYPSVKWGTSSWQDWKMGAHQIQKHGSQPQCPGMAGRNNGNMSWGTSAWWMLSKNGKRLYLLLWIARSAKEHAALQELWMKENGITVADWDTLDNEIGLEGILHGMETLLYSHGGEDINQLVQAILVDLWEQSVSLFSTLWVYSSFTHHNIKGTNCHDPMPLQNPIPL